MVVIWSIPLLLTVLCASVLEQLSGNAAPITQIESPAFDARKYLPVGAVVSHPGKDVVFADIDGDGRREVVIFYNLGSSPDRHEANILVLKRTGSDYIRYWQDIFSDSWGFEPPTGVLDLNKNGKLQIVAYRKIGASCPGILDIFESRDNTSTRITGPWGDGGQCQLAEIHDLNGHGKPEISVRVRKSGVNPTITRW